MDRRRCCSDPWLICADSAEIHAWAMVTAPLGASFPAERLTGARSHDCIAGPFSSSAPEAAGETPIASPPFPRFRRRDHWRADAAARLVAGVGGEESDHVRRPRGYTGLHMATVRRRRTGGDVFLPSGHFLCTMIGCPPNRGTFRRGRPRLLRVWCVERRECNSARGDIGSGAVGRRSRFAHLVDQSIAQSHKVTKESSANRCSASVAQGRQAPADRR